MSELDRLIEELCPDGVEYVKLKEVADIGTGSSDRKNADEEGYYPFFVRSKNVLRSNKYLFDEEAIIIPGEGGIGEIFHYIKGKYDLHQRAYRIALYEDKIITKYAYYYLKQNFKKFILMKAVSATVTSIRKPMVEEFLIPLPPLPVQEEIVRILDNFTELTAELTAELTSRRKQYEYYRDELLTFGDEVEWKTLEEVGEIGTGATPSTKNSKYWTNGTIPWMSSGEVNKKIIHSTEKFITPLGYEKSSTKIIPKNAVVIALAGQGKTRGQVAITEIELCTNQSLAFIIPYNTINSYYLYYYMLGEYHKLRHISSGDGTRGGLNLKMIRNYKIPIPPLSEQERIVSILDKFDALVNDISIGLPAEIEARQKQYEYYREKLLTFKELETKET